MTELQKLEFEMMKEVVRICDELDLRYYLVCGSALGAVKYGGFIPWDDDADIGLFREDYEIFISEAQKLLPKHLFLQNHRTDPKYPYIFGKIRNVNTAYIEKSTASLNMNHGVYIDVFPLDGYPENEEERQRLEKIKASCRKKLSCVFRLPRSRKAVLGMMLRRVCGYHRKTADIIEEYTKAVSEYPAQGSEIICNHGNWQEKLEYAPRTQYGDGAWASFEGLKVRVPEKYDEYLTQKYGNWRAELPKEQQRGHHYTEIVDLERPYTDYIGRSKRSRAIVKNRTNK